MAFFKRRRFAKRPKPRRSSFKRKSFKRMRRRIPRKRFGRKRSLFRAVPKQLSNGGGWPKYLRRIFTVRFKLESQTFVGNVVNPSNQVVAISTNLGTLIRGTTADQGVKSYGSTNIAQYYRYYKIKKATTRIFSQQPHGGGNSVPTEPYIYTWRDEYFDQGHEPTTGGAYGTIDATGRGQFARLEGARKGSAYMTKRTWLPYYIKPDSVYYENPNQADEKYFGFTRVNRRSRAWVPLNYADQADPKNPLFGVDQKKITWGGLGAATPGWENLGLQQQAVGQTTVAFLHTYTYETDYEVIFKGPIDYGYAGAPALASLKRPAEPMEEPIPIESEV